MGRRRVSNYDDVSERISGETTKSDVTERVFPPERVSDRIDLFINLTLYSSINSLDELIKSFTGR